VAASFRFLIALMGCLHLCGGHYGILQGIAWTRMLVSYSAEEGLLEGARQTFDGNHPCGLCLAIAEAKKQEADPAAPGDSPRGRESGLELKPFPLSRPLILGKPRTLDGSLTGGSSSSSITPIPRSEPDPPPPRAV
jgi:hypothetical protein